MEAYSGYFNPPALFLYRPKEHMDEAEMQEMARVLGGAESRKDESHLLD